jgi:hypothetical protein
MNGADFMSEVNKIENNIGGLNIRYSVDTTGNFPANWIMESDSVDIMTEYFNTNINNYIGSLTGDVGASARSGGITGITYSAGTSTFTLAQNINWNPADFIMLNASEKFNGGNFTITINGGSAFAGLFSVNATVGSFSVAPEIYNLKIIGSSNGLADGAGYFVRGSQKFFKIHHCSSSGNINQIRCGGISGVQSGYSSGECVIYECYSTGNISGLASGGIVGVRAAQYNGNCTIYNCYSTGNISGGGAGGITGQQSGQQGGTCTIYNCYSTGIINGINGGIGGIAGAISGVQGKCIIYNCYSTVDITTSRSGGIAGSQSGQDGLCIIYNCYTTGNITGLYSGGIAGSRSGQQEGLCIIYNCYTTGNINGLYGGGIAGINAAYDNGKCIIYNCYTSGTINNNCAGITSIDPTDPDNATYNVFILILQTYSHSPTNNPVNTHTNYTIPIHGNYDITLLYNKNVGLLNSSLTYQTPGFTSDSNTTIFTHPNSTLINKTGTNEFKIIHNPTNATTFSAKPSVYLALPPFADFTLWPLSIDEGTHYNATFTPINNNSTVTYTITSQSVPNFMIIRNGILVTDNVVNNLNITTYNITISAYDGFDTITRSFIIYINSVYPVGITFNGASDFSDNVDANYVLGHFTTIQRTTDTFTYELVTGTGDDDNQRFHIENDKLLTSIPFSYTQVTNPSIRIRTTNSYGRYFEQIIHILSSLIPTATVLYKNTKLGIPVRFKLTGTGVHSDSVLTFNVKTNSTKGSLLKITDDIYEYISVELGADSFTYVVRENNLESIPVSTYINNISDSDIINMTTQIGFYNFSNISFDGTTWTFGHLSTDNFFIFPNTDNSSTITFLGLSTIFTQ